MNDFAIFILTHGRADRVYTYKTLRKSGYTGKIYIIIDNEDPAEGDYRMIYGDQVIQFDKSKYKDLVDIGDNFDDRRGVVYARNASFKIAEELGLKYFMQLDDDYTRFIYKMDGNYNYIDSHIKSLDKIITCLLDFYKSTDISTLAIAQTGDYIGGKMNKIDERIMGRRKAMNTFICAVDRPIVFPGRINEDVNAYVWFQSMGHVFMTFPLLAIQQKRTQSNKGGMTELYLDRGTYVKSFYTVLYSPSCVRVDCLNTKHPRIHHRVYWRYAVPYILPEKYCKKSTDVLGV